jgi:hypothetical protein
MASSPLYAAAGVELRAVDPRPPLPRLLLCGSGVLDREQVHELSVVLLAWLARSSPRGMSDDERRELAYLLDGVNPGTA